LYIAGKILIIMIQQNYAHHARWVKGFHFILGLLLIIGFISSLVNIWLQYSQHFDMMSSLLIAVLFICAIQLFWYARQFAIKAQDRAIRAEENFRYFILTHKALDNRISMSQIIALRFAPDEEFVVLADRAVNETLSPDEIKREIKNWRADNYRA
jgi:hypothetical protein